MTGVEALDALTDLLRRDYGATFHEVELIDQCARAGEWTSIAAFFAHQPVNPVGAIQAIYDPQPVRAAA